MRERCVARVSRVGRFLLGLTFAATTAASAGPVDDARLIAAETEHGAWLSFGRTYANQRFSPLAELTPATVARLQPRWVYRTGITASFQATPLVADGVMYLTTPWNHVVALDARTGAERWRYRHAPRDRKLCCGPANRGAALGYGRVYVATVDARLVALDQATGRVVWDIALDAGVVRPTETREDLAAGDPLRRAAVTGSTGIGANMAPVVWRGKVIVGVTGVGYGLHLGSLAGQGLDAVVGFADKPGGRGFYAAFDAATGTERWRWHTVPDRGWEGEWRTSTADGAPLRRDIAAERAALARHPHAWKGGGGSAWTTPALDPALGLLYVGIGNPAPQLEGSPRPGDNLYTVSLAALDAETGRLVWHHQQVPHDLWGYDVASPPVLLDLDLAGRRLPAVAQAGKTGWLYVHDRRTGALVGKSEAFVPQENLFAPPTPEGVTIAPGAAGGASWSPVAYDPRSGLAYVAAMHMPMRYSVRRREAAGGQPAERYTVMTPAEGPRWGTLSAIEVATGRIRWQARTDQPLVGGALVTAGGLVFTGEGDGHLNAYDARTGARVWRFQCGAGVNAPPIAFELDGRQHIAVAAGGNALFGYKQGDALWVFALPR